MKRRTVPAMLAAVVLFAALNAACRPKQWEQVTIATATQGGTYYPLGQQLARILEGLPGTPIQRSVAEASNGSQENIQRLIDSKADIAFVMAPALIEASRKDPETIEKLGVLARLYTDVVQIVVRKGIGIETLVDLEGKRVFIGAERSGTRLVATKILEAAGLPAGSYKADAATSYADASSKLIDGTLEAAFIVSGMPTDAVSTAMETGRCGFLSIDSGIQERLTGGSTSLGLTIKRIPANLYRNQPGSVQTVGAEVLLVARNSLPKDLALLILETIFDNIADLLLAHVRAQDIKLTKAFEVPQDLPLHAGAKKFQHRERGSLVIATGPIGEKYFDLGGTIQAVLKERGIAARRIQTAGSLENAKLLMRRPTIAIMQYDIVLASRFGNPRLVYKVGPSPTVPSVKDIRQIALLHSEEFYVVMRRDKLARIERILRDRRPESEDIEIAALDDLGEALKHLPPEEEKLRVCVGPEDSGTQIVAQAILERHKIDSALIARLFLPFLDMVDRLHDGEIDGGFFTSPHSEAIKTILNGPDFRLLSLGSKERAKMTEMVFQPGQIEHGTYASQKPGEPAVQTIATRAVLVTTENLPFDVYAITKAIIEEEAYFSISGGAKAMAGQLPSIPLHPSAERYFKEAGYLPAKPGIDWLTVTATLLVILGSLTGGYRGLIKLRRDRTSNQIGREILGIPLEAEVRDSAERLLAIRDDIQERVRRRWWRAGELDRPRWDYLHGLISDLISEAKENLTRKLATDIRAAVRLDDQSQQQQRLDSIEHRIWDYFENGELQATQKEMLGQLLEECRREQKGPAEQG